MSCECQVREVRQIKSRFERRYLGNRKTLRNKIQSILREGDTASNDIHLVQKKWLCSELLWIKVKENLIKYWRKYRDFFMSF